MNLPFCNAAGKRFMQAVDLIFVILSLLYYLAVQIKIVSVLPGSFVA